MIRRAEPTRWSQTRRLPAILPAVSAALVLGLVGGGAVVWQRAAQDSPVVVNGPNSWTLGSLTLTDDATGRALFAAEGLVPGAGGVKCLDVSYAGSVPASVRLYAGAASDPDDVARYLDLTVEQGTGGGFGSCRGFASTATIYTGTLAGFTAKHRDFGDGVGHWAPAGAGDQTYRIRFTLDQATPNDRQSAISQAAFEWEARSAG